MSKHGILVIKNNNNEYLQYYDKRWDSYLFLNCKIQGDNISDIIKEKIQDMLNINVEKIEYLTTIVHTKYSVSHKMYREYEHSFYKVIIPLEKIDNSNEFIINDIKYKWFNKKELDNDARIQEVNSDIINYVYKLKM